MFSNNMTRSEPENLVKSTNNYYCILEISKASPKVLKLNLLFQTKLVYT